MLLVTRLARKLAQHLATISWQSVIGAFAGYVALSWLGLYLAQEPVATESALLFWYFLIVTSSTVGYGDYSASTAFGMFVISTWVIPFGLILWGTVIGRVVAGVVNYLQKRAKGMSQLHLSDHTLVIGYNGARTQQLLSLLLREYESSEQANITLCARSEKIQENPLLGKISFVRVENFSNVQEMARANVDTAKSILIDTPLDDVTLTTAMFCAQQNPHAHIMAYFHEETTAELLQSHCPNIECIPSVSVEMLAKAAVDPGSSALHHELLNVDTGQTQYSVIVPQDVSTLSVADIYLVFKARYQATLIAIKAQGAAAIVTNPDLNQTIDAGDRIYYIADERITQFNWKEL